MNFNLLKPKKEDLLSLKSLRPSAFNADAYWFFALGMFAAILIIMAVVGFKLFYSQYTEDYKETTNTEGLENLINVERLKNVIGKRENFRNKEISLPPDPSL